MADSSPKDLEVLLDGVRYVPESTIVTDVDLRAENERLRAELHRLHEYLEHIRRPEPYRIRAVIGLKGSVRYALQIVRSVCEYPDQLIEVNLP